MGWAGPESALKGLGRSRPNKISLFSLGQTQPRQQGWARIGLAHKHIKAGPKPAWPSERNPLVLGQNQPGPAQRKPIGGIIFPLSSSYMQNECSACRRKTHTVKKMQGEEDFTWHGGGGGLLIGLLRWWCCGGGRWQCRYSRTAAPSSGASVSSSRGRFLLLSSSVLSSSSFFQLFPFILPICFFIKFLTPFQAFSSISVLGF